MPKVVYNTRRYGRFGLSHLARHYYLSDCNGFTGEYDEDDIRVDTLDRHDPMLVKCVEDLRQEAYGMEAILAFREVQDQYRIEVDRDGVEKVITPEDALVWTSAVGTANVRLNLENGLAAGLKELPCSDKETIRLLVEECEYRGDTLDQCARERDEARAELSMANIEACALATAIQKSEYPDAKNFELRNSVAGVISQINNMYAGIRQQRDEAWAQLAATDRGTRERDTVQANYQFMVNRASDEKLDGYRELGMVAANAENERDEAIRELRGAIDLLREAYLELGTIEAITVSPTGVDGVLELVNRMGAYLEASKNGVAKCD